MEIVFLVVIVVFVMYFIVNSFSSGQENTSKTSSKVKISMVDNQGKEIILNDDYYDKIKKLDKKLIEKDKIRRSQAKKFIQYSFSERDFINQTIKNIIEKDISFGDCAANALSYFLENKKYMLNINADDILSIRVNSYSGSNIALDEYIKKEKKLEIGVTIRMSLKKDSSINDIEDFRLPDFLEFKYLCGGYGDYYQAYSIKIKNKFLKTKNNMEIGPASYYIKKDLIKSIRDKITEEQVEQILLTPFFGGFGYIHWAITYYNKINGNSFMCSCFRNAIEKIKSEIKEKGLQFGYVDDYVTVAFNNSYYKDNLCDFCKRRKISIDNLKPYIYKKSIEDNISIRNAENIVREQAGFKKIGEGWISETSLYHQIRELFPNFEIIREYSPDWLNKQRFDIFIKELNLAIEYQGAQHYKSVGHFGGDEGLKKVQERDKIKAEKSKKNGIKIVYFTYKEELTLENIKNKIQKYLMYDNIVSKAIVDNV